MLYAVTPTTLRKSSAPVSALFIQQLAEREIALYQKNPGDKLNPNYSTKSSPQSLLALSSQPLTLSSKTNQSVETEGTTSTSKTNQQHTGKNHHPNQNKSNQYIPHFGGKNGNVTSTIPFASPDMIEKNKKLSGINQNHHSSNNSHMNGKSGNNNNNNNSKINHLYSNSSSASQDEQSQPQNNLSQPNGENVAASNNSSNVLKSVSSFFLGR